MKIWRLGWSLAVALTINACTCRNPDSRPRPPGTRAPSKLAIAETAYDGGFGKGWYDYGWSQHEVTSGNPVKVNFTNYGGFIVAKPGLVGSFGGLVFRLRAPREYGEFLEVRLESAAKSVYPRVLVKADEIADLEDGWSEVLIPKSILNPERLAFDRIIFRAAKPVGSAWIGLDKIALLEGNGSDLPTMLPKKDVVLSVDCRATPQPINPKIYGIAYDPTSEPKDTHQFAMGATIRRWGGNQASRYNWELGNAWSAGADWYWENLDNSGVPGYSYRRFLEANATHGMEGALTLPMLGWVAKDTSSVSFPIAKFGAQQSTDPYKPNAGNGIGPDGKPIAPGPPTETSVALTADSIERWVREIRAADQKSGQRSVHQYILDNEPALWGVTHRDVHPDPETYDELLQKTIALGTIIRKIDPNAQIAGPAEWGWPGYFFSGKDSAVGVSLKPDRMAHDDVPLLAWYLRKLAEHERETGVRILDVVDVHFYPTPENLAGDHGGIDAATAALRIRSTRSLWDPTYVDEGWVKTTIKLVPRLKQWITENYPGRGISIGEWNYGAEAHMSSGLASAETLGRFGQNGVTSAYYWMIPPTNSPVFWAFRAFRDFDGKGAHFLDGALPTEGAEDVSLFASIDATGKHVVVVALNLRPDRPMKPTLVLSGCGKIATQRAFSFEGDPTGLKPKPTTLTDGSLVLDALAPYSITVLDLTLADDTKKP